MSPARPPRPNRRNPVRDAFLNVPLPELPDSGVPGTGEDAARRDRPLTDSAMTCPDGLVEEVLWGLLHGLTALVTTGGPAQPDRTAVHGTAHSTARGGDRD